jgi:hypothetical protein
VSEFGAEPTSGGNFIMNVAFVDRIRALVDDEFPESSDDTVIELVRLLYRTRDGIIDDPQRALDRLIREIGMGPCPFPEDEDE